MVPAFTVERSTTASRIGVAAGAVLLVLLVLFFPKGIAGTLRARGWGWIP